mmetsp:Transcript_15090/g.25209  ORF Transcript_15090/g.25209 Transcript_15090/m.25209 type:complete len:216 (+) Transcript_15090:148-795(+)
MQSRCDWDVWGPYKHRIPAAVTAWFSPKAAIVVEEGKIVACNEAWKSLCGFNSNECLGFSPKILQGQATSLVKAASFRDEVEAFGGASVMLANYTKDGRAFVHSLRAIQIQASGNTYYYTEGQEVYDEAIRRAALKIGGESAATWSLSADLLCWLVTLCGVAMVLLLHQMAHPFSVWLASISAALVVVYVQTAQDIAKVDQNEGGHKHIDLQNRF